MCDVNLGKKRLVSNVVFMGQGEPLFNYREVSKAIGLLSDNEGMYFMRW